MRRLPSCRCALQRSACATSRSIREQRNGVLAARTLHAGSTGRRVVRRPPPLRLLLTWRGPGMQEASSMDTEFCLRARRHRDLAEDAGGAGKVRRGNGLDAGALEGAHTQLFRRATPAGAVDSGLGDPPAHHIFCSQPPPVEPDGQGNHSPKQAVHVWERLVQRWGGAGRQRPSSAPEATASAAPASVHGDPGNETGEQNRPARAHATCRRHSQTQARGGEAGGYLFGAGPPETHSIPGPGSRRAEICSDRRTVRAVGTDTAQSRHPSPRNTRQQPTPYRA